LKKQRAVSMVIPWSQQEGVLERLAGPLALAPDRLQLPLRQRARVGQQPTHQRALAMIDVAHDHDVESLSV
jgi:hypothetical protein